MKCNIVKCRVKLTAKAFVTSCSHVFCPECANKSFNYALICPACESPLSDSKDIYLADLKPSEEWKSMIISAQKPETIAEICGRAISFWTYQMHQECCYQELLLKNFQERKTSNEKCLQTSIMQLKNELSTAQEAIGDLNKQVEIGKRKEADLLDQMNEKSRQMKKMQLLCDKMRKKVSLNAANGEAVGSLEEAETLTPEGVEQENQANIFQSSNWIQKWQQPKSSAYFCKSKKTKRN